MVGYRVENHSTISYKAWPERRLVIKLYAYLVRNSNIKPVEVDVAVEGIRDDVKYRFVH